MILVGRWIAPHFWFAALRLGVTLPRHRFAGVRWLFVRKKIFLFLRTCISFRYTFAPVIIIMSFSHEGDCIGSLLPPQFHKPAYLIQLLNG